MVSVGSKALPLRRRRTCNFVEDSLMGEDNQSYIQGKRKKGMNRKASGERHGFDGYNSNKNASGKMSDGSMKARKSSEHQNTSVSQTTHVRYYSIFYNFVTLLLLIICWKNVCAVSRIVVDVWIVWPDLIL